MAKTRSQKQTEIREFVDGLTRSKAVVFANLSSLKVNDASLLRRNAKKEEVKINTAKKTLLRLALKEAGLESAVDVKVLGGSVSILFGLGDAVAAAKVLEAFRKDHEGVKVLGGLLDGQWLSVDQVKALAKLPSKQELIAKLVGTLNAPISGFVNVLAGNLRGLVTVLGAIKDAKSA
jgi:large subunit ribosomal protein L10